MTRANYRRPSDSVRERVSHERWLLSYADLITLLFVFFAVMYSVSAVDLEKLSPAAASIQAALSMPRPVVVEPPASALAPGPRAVQGVPPGLEAPLPPVEGAGLGSESVLEEVRAQLTATLADAIEARRLEIGRDPRGLILSLNVDSTFATGSADVEPGARELIVRIAEALRPLENTIRVEGHTDDLPIRTPRYASNWELSTARASAVVEFLIRTAGVAPARLAAAGYSEHHPRVPNDSPENRARNRRIEIVVLDPWGGGRVGPGAETRS